MSLLDWRKQKYACDKCASIYSECHAKDRSKCKYHAPNFKSHEITEEEISQFLDGDIIPIERWLSFYKKSFPSEKAIKESESNGIEEYAKTYASETKKMMLLVPELLGLGEKNGDFIRGEDDFGGSDEARFCADWACDFLSRICKSAYIPSDEIRFIYREGAESCTVGNTCLIGDATLDLFVHEIAHVIEANNVEIFKRNEEYLEKRCAGEEPSVIETVNGKHELYGRKDKFFDKHSGVDYLRYVKNGDDYDVVRVMTEILSQGIQDIVLNPVYFYQKDKDHFIFTLKTLKGEW